MKFTKDQVIQEVQLIHDGNLSKSESQVYKAWAELADSWLASGDANYHDDGFKGFNERTPNDILVDCHLNNLLETPLSDQEFNDLMSGKLSNTSPKEMPKVSLLSLAKKWAIEWKDNAGNSREWIYDQLGGYTNDTNPEELHMAEFAATAALIMTHLNEEDQEKFADDLYEVTKNL